MEETAERALHAGNQQQAGQNRFCCLSNQHTVKVTLVTPLQETSEDLGKLLKTLTTHNKDLEPVQAAVVRDAQR